MSCGPSSLDATAKTTKPMTCPRIVAAASQPKFLATRLKCFRYHARAAQSLHSADFEQGQASGVPGRSPLPLEKKQSGHHPTGDGVSITANTKDSMAPSDLKHWLLVMRSHVVLLVACTLVAAFASGGLTMLKEKEYTATAKVLFNDPDFARRSIFSPPTDAARVLATYLQLEVLKEVSDLTSDAIADSRVDGASDLAPEDVSAMVSVVAVGDTDFVEIDATASGAKLSALVANIFARKLIAFRAERDRSKLNAAKRVAEVRSAFISGEGQSRWPIATTDRDQAWNDRGAPDRQRGIRGARD